MARSLNNAPTKPISTQKIDHDRQKVDIPPTHLPSWLKVKAFVLLNTELGQEAPIIEALKEVKEITTIYSLYGIYDLIIEMEADNMDRVKEIVFNRVRRLEHVKSTITLLTYGEPVINE